MKKYFLIFLFIFFTFGTRAFSASENFTAGFIPGPIWYSKTPLVDGEEVKIHTVVYNGDDKDLSTKVEFYDKSTLLGTRDVVVPKSEVKDVSISWVVTSGDHSIYARILSASVSSNETPKDNRSVKVSVKKVDGVPVSSAQVVKKEVEDAKDKIDSILPGQFGDEVSKNVESLDTFRTETYTKIENEKVKTKDEIANIGKVPKSPEDKKLLDGTDKPIAYIKLFLLSVAGFLFSNKIVFYIACGLALFLFLRYLYKKIRNR